MVEVSGVRGGGSVANGVGRPRTGSGFAVPTDQPAATRGPVSAGAVLHSSMLALQEAETETVRDREARRHGQAMLRGLAALQRALLRHGGAPEATLTELAALADAVPEATSPPLAALVRSITLRARIELARLEPAPAR